MTPFKTPPEKCRSEIDIPITGDTKPEGNIKIKDSPLIDVAVMQDKAPAKEYPETYRKLFE